MLRACLERFISGFLFIAVVAVLLLSACGSADIQAERKVAKSVKTVAIIPFSSAENLKKDASIEAESRFRKALEVHKYKIIARSKVNTVLKDNDFVSAVITDAEIKKIGKRLGADAVITGVITGMSEYQKDSRNYDSFIYGSQIFGDDSGKNYEVMAFPYLKFQITVKLVFVSDESVVITITNPEEEARKDISVPEYSSLDSYVNMVLNKLTAEVIKSLNDPR